VAQARIGQAQQCAQGDAQAEPRQQGLPTHRQRLADEVRGELRAGARSHPPHQPTEAARQRAQP